MGRTRKRHISEKSGEVRECVTYRFEASGHMFNVQAWGEHNYLPLATFQEIPVRVRTYISKNAGAQYALTMPTEEENGESF